MLTFQSFTGINNVLPIARLVPDGKTGATPLESATNVDIGLAGEVSRRAGYTEQSAVCHKNVHQADGFMLATVDGGDLTAIAGAVRTVLYPSLGVARVWYTNLPDGRTTFSNGSINGIASETAGTKWGVPHPSGLGAADDVAGDLHPGSYRYWLTHVRTSDGLEGGPVYSEAIDLTGGIVLTGLPTLAGHSINVYLTSHNDDVAYLAGNAAGSSFSFTAANDTLTLPCKTTGCYPAPVGTVSAFWRGRSLVAVGNVLYASRPGQWELFDIAKDFKQFPDDITLVQPVDDGIYIGTEKELLYLAGVKFDELTSRCVINGAVVLGSGVTVPGEYLGQAPGDAMVCIAGGLITAGFNGGSVKVMTQGAYRTAVTEVAATFRLLDDIPQYIAIEQ